MTFLHIHVACNVLMMKTSGTHTISNHGRAVNCTVNILSEQTVRVLQLDVGVSKIKKRPVSNDASERQYRIEFDSNEKRFHSSKVTFQQIRPLYKSRPLHNKGRSYLKTKIHLVQRNMLIFNWNIFKLNTYNRDLSFKNAFININNYFKLCYLI